MQGDFKAQKEAVWVVTNFTSGGSTEQIIELVSQGVLQPFCNMLDAKEAKTVLVVLDGLSNILQVSGDNRLENCHDTLASISMHIKAKDKRLGVLPSTSNQSKNLADLYPVHQTFL